MISRTVGIGHSKDVGPVRERPCIKPRGAVPILAAPRKRACIDLPGLLEIQVIRHLPDTRMQGKVRLYRRKLGVPAGAWFVYGSKWQAEEPNEDFWREPFPKRGKSGGKDRPLKVAGG